MRTNEGEVIVALLVVVPDEVIVPVAVALVIEETPDDVTAVLV